MKLDGRMDGWVGGWILQVARGWRALPLESTNPLPVDAEVLSEQKCTLVIKAVDAEALSEQKCTLVIKAVVCLREC
eukprot:scaffold179164_cov28-Tisochrysis_lutea.AAC.1